MDPGFRRDDDQVHFFVFLRVFAVKFTSSRSAHRRRVRPSPAGWTMTGFRSISAIASAWSAAKRDSATISSTSASRSAGLAPRTPSSSAAPREFAEQPRRVVAAERHRREGDVAQHLDMDAAEPDHQHRAVIGVAGHAEDHLDAGAGHRLHQHALDMGVRVCRLGAGQHGAVAVAHGIVAAQAEDDRAGLGLVQDVGRLHLERDRAADPAPPPRPRRPRSWPAPRAAASRRSARAAP